MREISGADLLSELYRYESQMWAEVWSDKEGCLEVGHWNQYKGTSKVNPTDVSLSRIDQVQS